MIVPPVERWTAGEPVDADTLNRRARDVQEFLLEPPQAMVRQALATQSISSATWTTIVMDTVDKDNDGIVDIGLNRVTVQTPGWYEIVCGVSFNAVDSTNDPKGRRIAAIMLNGVAGSTNGGRRGRRDAVPPISGTSSVRTGGGLHAMFLNFGDFLHVLGYQDSTVSRTTRITNTEDHSFLSIRWVSN